MTCQEFVVKIFIDFPVCHKTLSLIVKESNDFDNGIFVLSFILLCRLTELWAISSEVELFSTIWSSLFFASFKSFNSMIYSVGTNLRDPKIFLTEESLVSAWAFITENLFLKLFRMHFLYLNVISKIINTEIDYRKRIKKEINQVIYRMVQIDKSPTADLRFAHRSATIFH
ncbi:hypothetical protein BpHYR1_006078 [Brachionus plicatilis]|uniref:Uncharacterized protein n=1 Tax=Brachionus plicatilis TaxID=10195 RepID=A0A3M7RD17_BRAPC|nr:hypothetical protein BpHYR1_006078 [Brachionus plicatilis]